MNQTCNTHKYLLFQSDLAARNVLLTYKMKAKIADFGLSSRIYVNTSERKEPKDNVVPFRWVAYEIFLGKTAIKEFSDVWSYGVLIWEIFHLGSAVPYGDKKRFEEVIEFLQNGGRLSKPPMCPQDIYDLMLECWMENYLNRPTFSQLQSQLKKFFSKKHSLTRPTIGSHENLRYTEIQHEDLSSDVENEFRYISNH